MLSLLPTDQHTPQAYNQWEADEAAAAEKLVAQQRRHKAKAGAGGKGKKGAAGAGRKGGAAGAGGKKAAASHPWSDDDEGGSEDDFDVVEDDDDDAYVVSGNVCVYVECVAGCGCVGVWSVACTLAAAECNSVDHGMSQDSLWGLGWVGVNKGTC